MLFTSQQIARALIIRETAPFEILNDIEKILLKVLICQYDN